LKDRLYLLSPGFEDQGGHWVCHDCTAMEGYLLQFPHLREAIEVIHLPFPRPRAVMVDLLGEAHQGLPTLVIGDDWDGPEVQQAGGHRFVADSRPIMRYLAARYGAAPPHP
jgi:hypothetical protein